MALQVILADNQVIFRTGVARVLALEEDIQIIAQCSDLERLQEAVGSLRKSIVVFPSSITSDLHSLLDWIEQAGSRSVIILEHDTVLEDSLALRIEGIVLRSVAAPQLVDCLHRVNAGERSIQRAKVKSMPSPDRVGVMVLQRLTAARREARASNPVAAKPVPRQAHPVPGTRRYKLQAPPKRWLPNLKNR